MMDPKNQHTWKPVYMGAKSSKDGQFKIVYKSPGLELQPDSYSKLLHTPEELAAIKPTGGPKK